MPTLEPACKRDHRGTSINTPWKPRDGLISNKSVSPAQRGVLRLEFEVVDPAIFLSPHSPIMTENINKKIKFVRVGPRGNIMFENTQVPVPTCLLTAQAYSPGRIVVKSPMRGFLSIEGGKGGGLLIRKSLDPLREKGSRKTKNRCKAESWRRKHFGSIIDRWRFMGARVSRVSTGRCRHWASLETT